MNGIDPDKEVKRRQSIAYILRHRIRGRRIGVNSGGATKKVQRKMREHVIFTPSGCASGLWRFSFILVAMIISVFPIFVFALAASPRAHLVNEHSPLALIFAISIFVLLARISGFALTYSLSSISRFLRTLRPQRNE